MPSFPLFKPSLRRVTFFDFAIGRLRVVSQRKDSGGCYLSYLPVHYALIAITLATYIASTRFSIFKHHGFDMFGWLMAILSQPRPTAPPFPPQGRSRMERPTECNAGEKRQQMSLNNSVRLSLFEAIYSNIDAGCSNLVPGFYYCVFR